VGGQDHHEDVTQELLSVAHPEVFGVHVQLLAVKFAQRSKTFLDVVQVRGGVPKGGQHPPAMVYHVAIANYIAGVGHVPELSEEPLGPGVDDQQPGERWRDTDRHRDVDVPVLGVFPCSCRGRSGAALTCPGPCRHTW
uniref:Uncharacterized protein n=1 Tax=Serinus canaria TaxID=9135 RepID=A0A8C9N0S4_SERCA